MGTFWGIDIGGTYAKVGLISDDVFHIVKTIPTGAYCNPDEILEKAAKTILETDPAPTAIGIGTAGLINRSEGVINFSPNLPRWNHACVKSIMNNHIQAPVVVDNDCNVFAIGAINSGKIPSEGLYIFITLGTGIGGAIIAHGEILYGTGNSGEFGHSTVKEGGIPCPCGSDGCWERYAGKQALEWYYTRLTGAVIFPKDIAELAEHGDPAAVEAFREYGRWIAVGLANLANTFSPSGIFLGGGISAAFKHFQPSARDEYKRRCRHDWNVVLLEDSPVAGAFGAASMARNLC